MSEDLAAELADRLRHAHLQIASSPLLPDEKAIAARRLIALSDTAKQDLGSASRRLDRLLADLAADRIAPDSSADGTPRA